MSARAAPVRTTPFALPPPRIARPLWRQRGRSGVELCREPHPAVDEAAAPETRGKHRSFQRRLPRGYSRSGDARPSRHQIGSGCSTGTGNSLGSECLCLKTLLAGRVLVVAATGSRQNGAAHTRHPERKIPSSLERLDTCGATDSTPCEALE